jgi:hypothetical protein
MSTRLQGLLDDSPGTKTSPFSLMFLYHLALIVFSILGVFYHGYFYCFALFHIVVGNAILLRVIRAVTQNSKSLLWVGTSRITFMVFPHRLGCSWRCFWSSSSTSTA